MQDTHYLQQLVKQQKSGIPAGICSVCSSSPFVIDAAILQAVKTGTPVLIEATANQVNQFGGYTGVHNRFDILWIQRFCTRHTHG